LIAAIRDLNDYLNIPKSIKDCGIDENVFMANVYTLSEKAHEDQCTPANPDTRWCLNWKTCTKKAYYGLNK